jgi:hypothetical protein
VAYLLKHEVVELGRDEQAERARLESSPQTKATTIFCDQKISSKATTKCTLYA